MSCFISSCLNANDSIYYYTLKATAMVYDRSNTVQPNKEYKPLHNFARKVWKQQFGKCLMGTLMVATLSNSYHTIKS